MGKGKGGNYGAISTYMFDSLSGARRWSSSRAGQDLNVTLIESEEHVQGAVAMLRQMSRVAVDFETTTHSGEYDEDYGPHAGDIRLVQVGYVDPDSGEARQILFDGHSVDLAPLKDLFEDDSVQKIVHYCPFELDWARHHLGSDISSLSDTCFAAQSVNKELRSQVAARLLPKGDKGQISELTALLSRPSDSGRRVLEDGTELDDKKVDQATQQVVGALMDRLARAGYKELASDLSGWQTTERSRLKDLNERYLGAEMSKEEQASDWSARLTPRQLDYAAADAAVTLEVAPKMDVLSRALKVSKRISWRIDRQRQELQPA